MKIVKIYLWISAALYIVCVGLMFALRAAGLNQKLSTPEMFYGPAITIVSSWIIIAIVFALSRKRREKL
jgi:hypothetical protein